MPIVLNTLIAFLWGVMAAVILGATTAITVNDMLSLMFFMVAALCVGYVLCVLKEGRQ